MSSLYLKHRPESIDDVYGNDELKSSLSGMLADPDTCPHAFLFHGPTGCGKTTIGRIIAKALDCSDDDYREVDSADFRGIDTVREIRKQAQYRPINGPVRVWLIDECHKMTNDAQNAMLKILEDTPHHVYFILATTEPNKLIPTIKNRCSQFQVKLLTDKQMFRLLRAITKKENVTLQKAVYDQIVQDSLGHPRNALQILDQVLRVPEDEQLSVAERSAEETSQSIELCRALISNSPWKKIANILTGLKDQEPESIRRHIIGYCESVLLKGENDQAAAIIEEFYEPLYNIGFPGLVYGCYSIVKGE